MKNCDVVMKGGITSGVIFPRAIRELAKTYRLRNIGGASAGAIAAAGAAAAEYRRQVVLAKSSEASSDDLFAGFDELGTLTEWLQQPTGRGDETRLAGLFQAGAKTARLERTAKKVERAATSKRGIARKYLEIAGAASGYSAWSVRWVAATAVLLGIVALGTTWLLAANLTWAAAIPSILLVLLLSILVMASLVYVSRWVGAVKSLFSDVPSNFLGLCSGHASTYEPGRPALTDWLDRVIQGISCKGAMDAPPAEGEKPLTFGDLWGGASRISDLERRGLVAHAEDRVVNLEMITTCLTLAQPFRLPFGMSKFFFRPSEFRELFPEYIVKHLERTGREAAARGKHEGAPVVDGEELVAWPHPADTPVVVAARMSLSFPLLISAVPLWAADYVWPQNRTARKNKSRLLVERCWFSDGGISSNFPIHLFDSPLPRWPTFGINLRDFHPSQKKDEDDESRNVALISDYGSQNVDAWWRRIDKPTKGEPPLESPSHGVPTLGGFASVIIDAMKHWQDDALIRLPGYRDRIAHVFHTDEEGGMNLNMLPDDVEAMAKRGEAAAKKLVDLFNTRPNPSAPLQVSWESHRWIRFRAAIAALEELSGRFKLGYEYRSSAQDENDPDLTYQELLSRAPIDGGPHQWEKGQQDFALAQMEELMRLVAQWQQRIVVPTATFEGGFQRGAPAPSPELRIRPRL